jgi:hypothetical protein
MLSVAGLLFAFDMMSFIAWSPVFHKAVKRPKSRSSAPPLDVKVSASGPLITNAQGIARSTYLSSARCKKVRKVRFGAAPKVRAGLA